jgi:hypothetical protein
LSTSDWNAVVADTSFTTKELISSL